MSEHSQPTAVQIALPVDDAAGEDTTRVFDTGELAPLLADERQAVAYDDGEDEDLEISLEGALEAAAAVTAALIVLYGVAVVALQLATVALPSAATTKVLAA